MSRLFRDVEGGPRCPHGSVVCIGAFDGLHLGHQALVRHAVARARALALPAVALSFEPLPREFFAGDAPPPRLLLPRAKVEGLFALGCDQVGLLRFNASSRRWPPRTSCARVLVGALGAREVWVGPEFRFGKARGGDLALLQRSGASSASSRDEIAPVQLDGERVSSTRIRAALQRRRFRDRRAPARPAVCDRRPGGARQAARSHARLSRPPTCASPARRRRCAASTPSWVHGVGERPWPSVSSFGTRPTVDGVEPLLEAHLFDFDGDLYGRRIEVEFVAKLRDEVKFPDLPALAAQMHRDAEQARAILTASTDDEPPRERQRMTQPVQGHHPPARDGRSRCAATCPSASRRRSRAGRQRACTRASATKAQGPPAASCCTTARRTPTARSTSATRSTRCSRTSWSSRSCWPASTRPTCRAGTATACRSRSRSRRSTARSATKLDAAQFRQKCREYASEQIDVQRRDFKRLGVLGDWENPYRTMDFRFEADMLRALAKIVEQRPPAARRQAGALVLRLRLGAGRGRDRIPGQGVARGRRGLRRARPAGAGRARSASAADDDVDVAVPIWTTTPWTLPASLAVSLGPELDTCWSKARAQADGRRRWLVLAEALADTALARYGVEDVVVHRPRAGHGARRPCICSIRSTTSATCR